MSTPIEFGGEEQFTSPPEKLYGLLTNLSAMARTIPDLVSSEQVDERTLNCVVRPGFSFMRGTMRLAIALGECQPTTSAAMSVAAQGIGVGMKIGSNLQISPDGAGSKLDWTAQILERKGLISAVSPALLKGAADQVIRHAWQAVRKELGE